MRFYNLPLLFLLFFFIHCQPKKKEITKEQSPAVEVKPRRDSIRIGVFKSGDGENENRLIASYPITEYSFINTNEKKYAVSFVNKFNSDFRNFNKKNSELITGIDLIQHFDIPIHNKNFISFLYTSYASTGNDYKIQKRAVMYDLQAKKKLAIESTFKDYNTFKDFAEKVKKIAKDSINLRIENNKDFDKDQKATLKSTIEDKLSQGTAALQANYNAFYFTPDGSWHLFMNANQIANSELGTFQLDFSPDEIKPYIKASLFESITHTALPILVKSLAQDYPFINDSINCKTDKCIALTFDISPNKDTPQLLSLLKEQEIQASFFVIGQFAKYQPQLLKRILENGHSIGNQSLTHRDFVRLSKKEALQEIEKTDSIIEYITGYKPKFFRFPYGTYSKEKLKKINKPIIAYTLKIKDLKNIENDSLSSNINLNEVSKNDGLKDLNGAILKHDMADLNLDALKAVIDSLKTNGYQFVTLDQLFNKKSLNKSKVYFSGNID